MRIPSQAECLELWDQYRMPDNVRRHTEQVTKVATHIAGRLKESGIKISPELVRAAAMLHDLARPIDFKEYAGASPEQVRAWNGLKARFRACRHPEAAYRLLKSKYPEVAGVVRKHFYRAVATDLAPKTWEEKVLSLSDKYVAHDRVVGLKERLEEGNRRWHGMQTADAEKINMKYYELERQIIKIIGSAVLDGLENG